MPYKPKEGVSQAESQTNKKLSGLIWVKHFTSLVRLLIYYKWSLRMVSQTRSSLELKYCPTQAQNICRESDPFCVEVFMLCDHNFAVRFLRTFFWEKFQLYQDKSRFPHLGASDITTESELYVCVGRS